MKQKLVLEPGSGFEKTEGLRHLDVGLEKSLSTQELAVGSAIPGWCFWFHENVAKEASKQRSCLHGFCISSCL